MIYQLLVRSDIISITLDIMSTYLPCPLSTRVADSRKWYIPGGKTAQECTYCEECYEKFVRGTDQDKGFTSNNKLVRCNCDYPKENAKFGLIKGDRNVLVLDAQTMKPIVLDINGRFLLPLHRTLKMIQLNTCHVIVQFLCIIPF